MPLQRGSYTDTQRMELRSQVKLAGEIIAHYWPMRTFIHHNVLHGLESLDFEEAVRCGQQLLGGRGYFPNELFRDSVRSGRIRPEHVEAALAPLSQDQQVVIGGHRVSHREVLRAHLLHGIAAPANDTLAAAVVDSPERELLEALAERLRSVVSPPSAEAHIRATVHDDLAALGRQVTLASWCDRALGTQLWAQINGEMIEWCAAFLDEGQAVWTLPREEKTFYGVWKRLAQVELIGALWGIPDWRRKVADLPDRPEDAILDSFAALGLPEAIREPYCSLHLAALPGWAGFLKWRAEQQGYAWQEAYPASLIQYLAIRLFYERELVAQACQKELGLDGTFDAIRDYMELHPLAYFLRRERVAGRLPLPSARQADRLHASRASLDASAWDALAEQYLRDAAGVQDSLAVRSAAWRLLALSKALRLDPVGLLNSAPADLKTLLDWLDGFPESQHGPRWLRALEAGYQERLLAQLTAQVRKMKEQALDGRPNRRPVLRPSAQAVLCIDVRSEVFRRHLETIGNYETFGFPGFFICFIRYRAFGSHYEVDSYPVIMQRRNSVREIPRTYQDQALPRHRAGARWVRAGHTLVHDLKEHVITPYVMVESLGWFYILPFFGKSLFALLYQRALAWLKRAVAPPVSTTLTVDKLSKSEAEEMVAAEQRAAIRLALRERLGLAGSLVTPELVESLRLRALNGESSAESLVGDTERLLPLSVEEKVAFVEELRRHYRIDRRWAASWLDRITRTGLTLEEQATTVETALRILGLTSNFARLVLLCAHTSTSDNNPFEAALDCGACGGNEGKPNVRLLAIMANRPQVRERVAKNGIEIPPDTHFLAGQIDTTTDVVEVFDLEDVPPTHRKDLAHLLKDLGEAGRLASLERCTRLPGVGKATEARSSLESAARHVRRRSRDWSQVRPEWGLSGNAAFIIGGRWLTRGLALEGRTFMNNYSYRDDPTGRLLEILMTAPQVVGQWINMEHYFSTVDQDANGNCVYGSGSKVYHNVVGRFGIMFGTQSDLRTGLAWQTVMDGERPYHEPMRLLTIIEAPLDRISALIQRHVLLQHFYDGRWVHLVAVDPEELTVYRYLPKQGWCKLGDPASGGNWSCYPWQ